MGTQLNGKNRKKKLQSQLQKKGMSKKAWTEWGRRDR